MTWWAAWLFVSSGYYLELCWAMFKDAVSGMFESNPKVRPLSEEWVTALQCGRHDHKIADIHMTAPDNWR